MADYTKGEWGITKATDLRTRFNIIKCNGVEIARCILPANAHLIAAAPEMYEALKTIINSETIISKDNFNAALEALAKAEGKS